MNTTPRRVLGTVGTAEVLNEPYVVTARAKRMRSPVVTRSDAGAGGDDSGDQFIGG